MIPTSAYVRFAPEGAVEVDVNVRVSGNSHFQCCTYPDSPPILALCDRHVSVSITVPDSDWVSAEDVDTARRLAKAVAHYVTELETRMSIQATAVREGAAA